MFSICSDSKAAVVAVLVAIYRTDPNLHLLLRFQLKSKPIADLVSLRHLCFYRLGSPFHTPHNSCSKPNNPTLLSPTPAVNSTGLWAIATKFPVLPTVSEVYSHVRW